MVEMDFRIENLTKFIFHRFFAFGDETRHERRMHRAELREIGRQEAMKRGKTVDENGKVIDVEKN